jgi:hypothetical protein
MTEDFYERLKACQRCRAHPDIARLSARDFRLDWLYPHEWGDPTVPVQHVIVAMEPNLRGAPPTSEPRLTNSLNEPLQFAVRAFLGSRRYLMTNIAKCSMKADDLCRLTRVFRINQCKGFFQGELDYCYNCDPSFCSQRLTREHWIFRSSFTWTICSCTAPTPGVPKVSTRLRLNVTARSRSAGT